MKKKYSLPDHIKKQKNKALKIERNKRKRKHKFFRIRNISSWDRTFDKSPILIHVPADFRLIDNTTECLEFFREIRSRKSINFFKNQKVIFMSLKYVELIDYAAISALISISMDLKARKIVLSGDYPDNPICKKFIIDSGFLNHMVDTNNKKFPVLTKSDFIFFEKGSGKLSKNDRKKISLLVKDVVGYLMGDEVTNLKPVKSIILEICANSIEHANTENKQWLLGVKYGKEEVTFTVSDVGRGILETLHRKFAKQLKDIFRFKPKHDIVLGAFERKYGSSTQEVNRNKGLPSVKANSDVGTIKNLVLLTNNVILHFEDGSKSKTLKSGTARFRGTLYQWKITKDCIINAINTKNEEDNKDIRL